MVNSFQYFFGNLESNSYESSFLFILVVLVGLFTTKQLVKNPIVSLILTILCLNALNQLAFSFLKSEIVPYVDLFCIGLQVSVSDDLCSCLLKTVFAFAFLGIRYLFHKCGTNKDTSVNNDKVPDFSNNGPKVKEKKEENASKDGNTNNDQIDFQNDKERINSPSNTSINDNESVLSVDHNKAIERYQNLQLRFADDCSTKLFSKQTLGQENTLSDEEKAFILQKCLAQQHFEYLTGYTSSFHFI